MPAHFENDENVMDRPPVHTMPAHFENDENVTDRPPVHTKTAHILPADIENGRSSKWNSNQNILKAASCEYSKVMKTEHKFLEGLDRVSYR